MTREEFTIALDTSLSKDRINLCLEYINELESRTCKNCKHDYCGCSVQDSIFFVDTANCRPNSNLDNFGCNQWEL